MLLVKLVLLSLRSLAGAPKIDIASIQKFSDGFCSLIGGHICQYIFSEMVLENQDIGNSR